MKVKQRIYKWLRVQACKRLHLWPAELYAQAIEDRVNVNRRGGKQVVVDITVNVTNMRDAAVRDSLVTAVGMMLRKKAGWL